MLLIVMYFVQILALTHISSVYIIDLLKQIYLNNFANVFHVTEAF